MAKCPRCGNELREEIDGDFNARICMLCSYYESDSPAYKENPELFACVAGDYYLTRRRRRLSELVEKGLTKEEAEMWFEQEPTFTRRIFTPLDSRRRLYRTCMQALLPLRRLNGAGKNRRVKLDSNFAD